MNRKNEFGKGEPKLCGLDLKATSFQTLLYLTAPSVLKSCVNGNTEQMESPLRGVGLQRFLCQTITQARVSGSLSIG